MKHSISYYLELPEYGSPEEISEFETFLDDVMCWTFEDFIAYLEWEEAMDEIIEEEIFYREMFEDIEADREINYQKEHPDYECC